MAKIEIKSDKTMPFGGIFSVIREFSTIERLINSELGQRVKLVGYQYSEIMRAMMCNYLCGGDRMEDIKIYQPGIEYMPGVAVLTDMSTGDDVIVRVENRDGNANVKFHQADTLERTFNQLEAAGLWTTKVRCDCGSYSREIIETISRHCHRFYIRANMYNCFTLLQIHDFVVLLAQL